ncbi:simple sugar transport system permease protein [Aminobacter lissarensis]|uniref:Simple sugar transport system permease protein n=1 Tax=Aminobacter carboxidus TaxID=376165 RepID=A0A8E2BF99_9HYPH|nr:ABC transporter permease [Aminobacter lissarensis]MBB6468517.1 simple sugar transport system permease protein [Aminobacter lissarensis]
MNQLFQEAIIVSILAATVRIVTPLLFSALGELITQRAGIWNMGVEGTMLTGAFAAYLAATATGSLWLAVLAAVLAGALMGAVIAFMTSLMRVDHFIAGLGLNLLAGGLTLYWFQSYIQGRAQPTFSGFQNVAIPLLSDIPLLGPVLFSQRALTYVALLAVPAVWFLLYRTRYGLELRCLGENPKALDVKGLSVTARQFAAVMLGSAMTGLGGGFLMLGFSDRFLADFTAGRGWIVVVALIAGNWRPRGVLIAVTAFAFLESLATHLQVIGAQVPHQLLLALPYLASIALLMGLRFRTGQPARLGVPYARE